MENAHAIGPHKHLTRQLPADMMLSAIHPSFADQETQIRGDCFK